MPAANYEATAPLNAAPTSLRPAAAVKASIWPILLVAYMIASVVIAVALSVMINAKSIVLQGLFSQDAFKFPHRQMDGFWNVTGAKGKDDDDDGFWSCPSADGGDSDTGSSGASSSFGFTGTPKDIFRNSTTTKVAINVYNLTNYEDVLHNFAIPSVTLLPPYYFLERWIVAPYCAEYDDDTISGSGATTTASNDTITTATATSTTSTTAPNPGKTRKPTSLFNGTMRYVYNKTYHYCGRSYAACVAPVDDTELDTDFVTTVNLPLIVAMSRLNDPTFPQPNLAREMICKYVRPNARTSTFVNISIRNFIFQFSNDLVSNMSQELLSKHNLSIPAVIPLIWNGTMNTPAPTVGESGGRGAPFFSSFTGIDQPDLTNYTDGSHGYPCPFPPAAAPVDGNGNDQQPAVKCRNTWEDPTTLFMGSWSDLPSGVTYVDEYQLHRAVASQIPSNTSFLPHWHQEQQQQQQGQQQLMNATIVLTAAEVDFQHGSAIKGGSVIEWSGVSNWTWWWPQGGGRNRSNPWGRSVGQPQLGFERCSMMTGTLGHFFRPDISSDTETSENSLTVFVPALYRSLPLVRVDDEDTATMAELRQPAELDTTLWMLEPNVTWGTIMSSEQLEAAEKEDPILCNASVLPNQLRCYYQKYQGLLNMTRVLHAPLYITASRFSGMNLSQPLLNPIHDAVHDNETRYLITLTVNHHMINGSISNSSTANLSSPAHSLYWIQPQTGVTVRSSLNFQWNTVLQPWTVKDADSSCNFKWMEPVSLHGGGYAYFPETVFPLIVVNATTSPPQLEQQLRTSITVPHRVIMVVTIIVVLCAFVGAGVISVLQRCAKPVEPTPAK